jgi:hypothetical protein
VGDNVGGPLQPGEIFTFSNKQLFFDKDGLRDLPVYVVRGSEDAHYMSWSSLVEASMSQDQFQFPALYHTKYF